MLFIDPLFLFAVLPLAICLFYVFGTLCGPSAALGVIVVTSAIFYAPYGALPFSILAGSLCVNLAIGLGLSSARFVSPAIRQLLLTGGLVFNFLLLGAFKYFDQIAALVAPMAGPILGVVIPAGISFYTFHQAVFLLDAFKRQEDVGKFLAGADGAGGKLSVFTRYAAFVALFPQLIIGPITYMSEFSPQALRPGFGRLRWVDLQVGVTLVIVGLFKKLVLADNLSTLVSPTFAGASTNLPISSNDAIMAIAGYFFQLYFDFSGYSDIALGIARCFSIRLPINFDSPLRASGIVDWYRRWHITLTRVIALFVFTPLSLWGTRYAAQRGYKGWKRRAFGAWLPFLLNFQIIALWHAAKGTFALFGLFHGLWYVLETEVKASKTFKAYRARTSDRFRGLTGMAISPLPLMLSLALFRSDSVNAFGKLVASVGNFAPPEIGQVDGNPRGWLKIAIAAFIVYLLPNIYEVLRNYRPGIVTYENRSTAVAILRVAWRPNLVWGLYLGGLAIVAFTYLNIPAPFLYAGF